MQQRNFLVAIGLSVFFLVMWYAVVIPRFAPPPPPVSQTPSTPPLADASAVITGQTSSSNAMAVSKDTPASADVILRNPQNEIVFTSAGGAVRHWTLQLKGQAIDLVQSTEAAPLSLATFPDVRFRIRQTNNAVTLTGEVGKGVQLVKRLTLSDQGYLQDLTLDFKNTTDAPIEVRNWDIGWGPGIGTAPTEQKENSRLIRTISMGPHVHGVWPFASYIDKRKPGEYEAEEWSAIDNRYFMVAFIPPANVHPTLIVTGTKDQARVVLRDTTTLPPNSTVHIAYQLYAGPKGYTQLKHYGKHLEEGVDFGTFSALGKLILSAIYRLQKLTGNYGWAIVLLTIGLQVLLFPLTRKSLSSQLAMRRLQPQIAALQRQYKSDPKKLNVEMMGLYKKTGTNPFGGCLPMILQLPIFWALFTTLRNAYELRGAPFIGWIHDLAAPDPLRILPVIMGIAMFFQQRMTGNATDPTQKQMMYMMPVIFTFMFINFPSGLVLYWLTNNLVMLLFQYFLQRRSNLGKGTPDSPQVVFQPQR